MAEPKATPAATPERARAHPNLIDPETAPRPRIKELEVMVAEVIKETPDTATLVLFTGNDRLDYQPGHFLTIEPQQFPALERFCKYFEDSRGRRSRRAPTPSPRRRTRGTWRSPSRKSGTSAGLTKYPPLLSPLLVCRTAAGHAHGGHRLRRAPTSCRRTSSRAPTTWSTSAPAPASSPTTASSSTAWRAA